MSAAEHLRDAIDMGCTRDDHDHIADHRAEVLAEAKREVVAWLVKKAREGTPVVDLASKVDRGAIRLFGDVDREKTIPSTGTAVTPDAARLDLLRTAVTEWGGEWTTRRVQHLYQARYSDGLRRHQAREDLNALAAEGLLVFDEAETTRRVYRPASGGHRA